MTDHEPLFTRATLAAFLHCTPRTIDNLRSKGLPHIMVGDSPRFERRAVLEWCAANPLRKPVQPLSFEEANALGAAIREYPDPNRVRGQ